MTGPEHYREAERLLLSCQVLPATASEAATYPQHEDGINTISNALIAAQVHATLALAAATGLNDAEQGFLVEDLHAWQKVASDSPDGAS